MTIEAIENQIKTIPGNEAALESLYQLLDEKNAIAFVGAGASAGLWPLWNNFLHNFVDQGLKLGKISEEEAKYFKKEAGETPLETAQQLRNELEDRDYFDFLRTTFKDKSSPKTGGSFTLTHKALLQLPIHNYMTLNYDAGLTNARAALYPNATTSYFFWDQEEARGIREKGYKKRVLHAHGRFDRADSIILTLDDYRRAYDNRAFVRLLNEVFNSESLIFVGFGMTDPYIKQLFNNINKDSTTSAFRHVAFVGLKKEELPVVKMHRKRVEMVYGARVLFYPSENHHKALTDWLQMLVEKYSDEKETDTAEAIKPILASPQVKARLQDKYVHKPTDDANYKGRVNDFAILNRWANDPGTKMIAITGIGGQGKTSVTGRWLKQERDENLAQMPVFYWSFYEDMDVKKFLEEIVEFCLPIIQVYGHVVVDPIQLIIKIVEQTRIMLVLDGLEVMQDDAKSQNHGKISHPLLNTFLQQWIRRSHQGLMILTSRFHFPQLSRFSGVGFHQLDLVRLSRADGIALLSHLGLFGSKKMLQSYVDQLSGHPLALRVLASAVNRSAFGDLALFKQEGILVEDDEDELAQKLDRLLQFYEKQLQDGQRELLGIISLFKRPVDTESFVTLLSSMKSLKDTPLANADSAAVEQQLQLLIKDFLIEKSEEGITTHPVIRDYFRSGNKIKGTRREVADFLSARPGSDRPQTIEEVRDLVEAVQLLCDEEEFRLAFTIYTGRLTGGGFGFNVFRTCLAVSEGLECNLAFIGTKDRQKKIGERLGMGAVAARFSGAGLYSTLLGNLKQAIDWRKKCLEIRQNGNNQGEIALELSEISYIEMAMGLINKALITLSIAKNIAYQFRKLEDLRTEFSLKAYYEFLLGNSNKAYQNFETSLFYEQKRIADTKTLYSRDGNNLAEFLIRINELEQFKIINKNNIKDCSQYLWTDKLGICYLFEGWFEILRKRYTLAEEVLIQAEEIFLPSGMLQEIARLDWIWGLYYEAKGDYQKGLQHVNDALLVCADKGFRLWHADNLVLRGRLYLMQFEKEESKDLNLIEKAGDDADNALKIAEDTGYIWAKVDALDLFAAYHQMRVKQGVGEKSKEKELAQRYAKESAEIRKGLYLTKAQIEEAKRQAKEEFEKMTADWPEED